MGYQERGAVPIIGGPLDGQRFTGRKAPLYLAEDGAVLGTKLGNRTFGRKTIRKDALPGPPCYIKRVDLMTGRLRYVHSSIALVDDQA